MSLYTVDRMSDIELVAAVLGLSPTEEVCARVASAMATEGWLHRGQLTNVVRESGVGDKRLARLEASVELGRRTLAARAARKGMVVSTPEDVVRIVKPLLTGKDRETFLCLALNTKNHLLKVIEVSIGSLAASVVHPRELFRECVANSAASCCLAHQHPSSDPTPSGADVSLTRRLVSAGSVLGIEVLDHVILGGDGHSSLRDLGLM